MYATCLYDEMKTTIEHFLFSQLPFIKATACFVYPLPKTRIIKLAPFYRARWMIFGKRVLPTRRKNPDSCSNLGYILEKNSYASRRRLAAASYLFCRLCCGGKKQGLTLTGDMLIHSVTRSFRICPPPFWFRAGFRNANAIWCVSISLVRNVLDR